MKRFISVVLVVVMILTVCATAFADEGPFSTPLLKKDKAAQSGTLQKSTKTGILMCGTHAAPFGSCPN